MFTSKVSSKFLSFYISIREPIEHIQDKTWCILFVDDIVQIDVSVIRLNLTFEL